VSFAREGAPTPPPGRTQGDQGQGQGHVKIYDFTPTAAKIQAFVAGLRLRCAIKLREGGPAGCCDQRDLAICLIRLNSDLA
jgi:hypothetical protein